MRALLFILIPTFLFSQEITYQDTIFTNNNKPYPCVVEKVNEEKIFFIYSNHRKEQSRVEGISKLIINNFGTVYKNGAGYTHDIDEINTFLEKRNEILLAPPVIEIAKQDSIVSDSVQNITTIIIPNSLKSENILSSSKEDYPWSFGFIYTPYYSGKIYYASMYDYRELYFNSYSSNYYMMSGEFSYKILDKLRLTLEVSYSASSSEIVTNYDYRNVNDTSGYRNENIDIEKFLFLNIGAKWYLKNLITEKVTPFVAIKFGKQFAFINRTNEREYYPSSIKNEFEDNVNDFLQKINSPFFVSASFGVEYSFNKSLSLISNMEFLYLSSDATYKSRDNSNYNSISYTYKKNMNVSSFNTKFGIGLNFYF